ncbi:MAG: SDR family oxidoreductase [Myxococcota bacterium]
MSTSVRRVVITGASRGIGLELTRQHLEAGDQVVATCRTPAKASALHALAAAHAARCTVVELDVGEEDSIARAARQVGERFEGVELVWSNAGVYPGSPGTPVREAPLGQLHAADGLEVLRVNAVGAILVAQAFLPLLRAGRSPKLAALSSGYGSVSDNHGTPYWYGASKAALNMLHRSLAFDGAARGVTVALLSPGWTQTDMGGPRAPDPLPDVVTGLRRVVERLRPDETGGFFDWRGRALPW